MLRIEAYGFKLVRALPLGNEGFWDSVLNVESGFRVTVADGVLLEADDCWPLELVLALQSWLDTASDGGPAFVYSPLDEEDSLLVFSRNSVGLWSVSSPRQSFNSTAGIGFKELHGAVLHFVRSTLAEVRGLIPEYIAVHLESKCT